MDNKKVIIILLTLCIAITVFIYFFETKMKSTDEKELLENSIIPVTSEDIFGFERNNVIVKKNIANEKSKNDNIWKIIKPINTNVDEQKIQDLLILVGELKFNRKLKLTNPKDLQQYSIDLSNELRIIDNKNTVYQLFAGAKNFDGSMFIYSKSDSCVYSLKTDVSKLFNWSLNDVRNKRLTDLKLVDINIFRFTINNLTCEFDKKTNKNNNDAEWLMSKPLSQPANWYKVNGLVDKILSANADYIIDNVVSTNNFNVSEKDEHTANIVFFANDTSLVRPVVFYFGRQLTNSELEKYKLDKSNSYLFCRNSEKKEVFIVKKDIISDFYNSPLNFRSENVIEPSEQTNIATIYLQKENNLYEVYNKTKAANSTQNIQDTTTLPQGVDALKLIDNLKNLKVKEFISYNPADLIKYQLNQPDYKIFVDFLGANNKIARRLTLNIKNKDNKSYFAMFNTTNQDIIIFIADLQI